MRVSEIDGTNRRGRLRRRARWLRAAAVCGLVGLSLAEGSAQPRGEEIGRPHARILWTADLPGARPNYSGAALPDGTMAFGSTGGILHYDGRDWHHLQAGGNAGHELAVIGGVAIAPDGSIWVEFSSNQIGRFDLSPDGSFVWADLTSFLPAG